MKENIYRMISKFAKNERDEVAKERKKRKMQVCIDPDSLIGKEIKYQTALLHEILNEVRETRKELQTIRSELEFFSKVTIHGNVNADRIKGIVTKVQ